jgi:predicted ATPase
VNNNGASSQASTVNRDEQYERILAAQTVAQEAQVEAERAREIFHEAVYELDREIKRYHELGDDEAT